MDVWSIGEMASQMVVFLSKVSRVWRWNIPLIHLRADSGLKNVDVTKSLLYRIMTADTRPNGCSVFNLCEGSAQWWTRLPGLQVCCDSLSILLLITHAEQRRPASLQPIHSAAVLDSIAKRRGVAPKPGLKSTHSFSGIFKQRLKESTPMLHRIHQVCYDRKKSKLA